MTQTTAMLLSIAIEAPVVLALAWVARWTTPRDPTPSATTLGRIALVALAATLVSHPLAWHANQTLVGVTTFAVRATAIEMLVVVIETALYWRAAGLQFRRAALAALLANAASFGVGLLLFYW